MAKKVVVLSLWLVLVPVQSNLVAADPRVKPLRGINTIFVQVDEMNPEASADGLSVDQVQQDAELRLRQSGLRVGTPSSAILYIRVQLLKSAAMSIYVYDITIQLDQEVSLVRDRSIGDFRATTWETGTTGIAPASKMKERVRQDLADFIDRFINAYLEANPKDAQK